MGKKRLLLPGPYWLRTKTNRENYNLRDHLEHIPHVPIRHKHVTRTSLPSTEEETTPLSTQTNTYIDNPLFRELMQRRAPFPAHHPNIEAQRKIDEEWGKRNERFKKQTQQYAARMRNNYTNSKVVRPTMPADLLAALNTYHEIDDNDEMANIPKKPIPKKLDMAKYNSLLSHISFPNGSGWIVNKKKLSSKSMKAKMAYVRSFKKHKTH